ncbi:MAG: DAK2 domain-containing protein [Bacilli bacterium]|nr:DAK2 domain-containing protein [Bacilli bacterium]
MAITIIDGSLFKALIINGAANLKANYQYVDSLNVFPVPDGDTGTNMKMTIEGGINEISTSDDKNIYELTKKLSRGMLMGARGNSGVILSQLFRGFNKGCKDQMKLNAMGLAQAFQSGVEQAYKAVMKPAEGTILTVAREAAEKMKIISYSKMPIVEFFEEYLAEAKKSLENTPNLLPVLKEAGVVDSGGAGYVCIIEGMLKALKGETITFEETEKKDFESHIAQFTVNPQTQNNEFGYCTEFLVDLDKEKIKQEISEFDEKTILDRISPLGNSIVILKDENIVKCHIHTLKPGDVLNIAQEYGEFIKLKIENMSIQHSQLQQVPAGEVEMHNDAHAQVASAPEKPQKPEVRSKYSVVAVASGDGLVSTFKEMGVDYVVSGGQSMNPCTEDFINGFDTLNADNIIVFPNNKNILLAARQAAKIYKESNVIVVPTSSIAEGFSALTMLDLNDDPEQVVNNLHDVIERVTSISVTYSVRDTKLGDIEVHKDDFIGIMNGKIVSSCKRRYDTMKEVLKKADLKDKDIITIIYGKDVSERYANDLVKYIKKTYPNIEIELINGGQDVYSYIIALE